jgi:4a-hydroxytetrahydrobiopterin dehydratase
MEIQSASELTQKKCVPCEGGVEPCPLPFVTEQLASLERWELSADKQRIVKKWEMKNFVDALAFFNKVGEVAEAEAHHPDLHLESYKNVRIEIWTHAIGGLSENDFILAAKIDEIGN